MVSSLPAYMQVVQQDVDEELGLDQGGIRALVRVGPFLTSALFRARSGRASWLIALMPSHPDIGLSLPLLR